MKILISHPTGNQNSRNAARAFAERAMLQEFVTTLNFDLESAYWKRVPPAIQNVFRKRDYSDIGGPIHNAATHLEAGRLLSLRLGLKRFFPSAQKIFNIDRVYDAIDDATAKRVSKIANLTSVYAYEGAARRTFEQAGRKGLFRVYELPIGYWRRRNRLSSEQEQLRPEWAHTWQSHNESTSKFEDRDAELANADCIVVPSCFVADTLSDYPGRLAPIVVVPYGCPEPIAAETRTWRTDGKLRVLFVGGISERKGLSYLLEAIKGLSDRIEMTFIGAGPGEALLHEQGYSSRTASHPEVLRAMREHDVLAFPSLFEGYGLVVAEALSQGLPVIATPNSGATGIIQNGVNGWIVPIRDAAAIRAQLDKLLADRSLSKRMGLAALQGAAGWTWRHYRSQLSAEVLSAMSETTNRLAS